jgi:hypothetical protein
MVAAPSPDEKDLTDIPKSSFDGYLETFYNNYDQFVSGLSPDKIVLVFNIILGGMSLSSFLPIVSAMLSENIIKRIKILDSFPLIKAILQLRIDVNKKLVKIYLIFHLILIILGIFCNIYMYFL